MGETSQPLVSVVTPVYNGAKYLAECIESVLAQTYENWEYVIVNNRSSDATSEIATRYARKDARIRVVNNDQFLPQIVNWNHAVRQMSKESAYCKIVHADDWIYPECINKMVSLGEVHPSVSIVSSYALRNNSVDHCGLEYESEVFRGEDICRRTLLGDLYVFGTPTSLLIRSDRIRCRNAFYDESVIYADMMICFDILKDSDVGFVHQVLTFSRTHEETVTTAIGKFDHQWYQAHLIALKRYGRVYLTQDEYEQRLKEHMKRYYRFLAQNVFRQREGAFWRFHKDGFRSVGLSLDVGKLIRGMCIQIVDAVGNPINSLVRIRNSIRGE